MGVISQLGGTTLSESPKRCRTPCRNVAAGRWGCVEEYTVSIMKMKTRRLIKNNWIYTHTHTQIYIYIYICRYIIMGFMLFDGKWWIHQAGNLDGNLDNEADAFFNLIISGWDLRLIFLAPTGTSIAAGPMLVEEDDHAMSCHLVIVKEEQRGKNHCDQILLLANSWRFSAQRCKRIQRFCPPIICRFSQLGVPQGHPIIQNHILEITQMGQPMVWGTQVPTFSPPAIWVPWVRRQGKVMVRAKSRSQGKMSMASMRPAGLAKRRDWPWWLQHVSTSFSQFRPRGNI